MVPYNKYKLNLFNYLVHVNSSTKLSNFTVDFSKHYLNTENSYIRQIDRDRIIFGLPHTVECLLYQNVCLTITLNECIWITHNALNILEKNNIETALDIKKNVVLV